MCILTSLQLIVLKIAGHVIMKVHEQKKKRKYYLHEIKKKGSISALAWFELYLGFC